MGCSTGTPTRPLSDELPTATAIFSEAIRKQLDRGVVADNKPSRERPRHEGGCRLMDSRLLRSKVPGGAGNAAKEFIKGG